MGGEFILYYVSLEDGRVCDHTHLSLTDAYKCLDRYLSQDVYGEVWCEEYVKKMGRFVGAFPIKEADEG